MGIGKTLGIGFVFYILFNMIFILAMVAVGGFVMLDVDTMEVTAISIGSFFSDYVGQDIVGFVALLMSPGGVSANPLDSVLIYLADIMAEESENAIAVNVVGLLWATLPGILTGVITGLKFSDEDGKAGFFGVFLAVLIITCMPMVLSIIGQLDPNLPNHVITENFISAMYLPGWNPLVGGEIAWEMGDYLVPVLVGTFNGFLFGGFAAMTSSNL